MVRADRVDPENVVTEDTMTLVHIDLLEGHPPERLERLIAEVTDAVGGSLRVEPDTVHVVINEMKPHQYGLGGKAWPAVVEARRHQDHDGHATV
jgi:4-oxalocrotonate tautomerase